MEWNWEIILALISAILTIIGIFIPNMSGIFDSILRLLGGI